LATTLTFNRYWIGIAAMADIIQSAKGKPFMSNNPAQESLKHAKTDLPVHDLILQRWSPRAFTTQAVTDADLKTLFTAASWAASSYNEQPWRFLVGRKGDETYKKLFDTLAAPNQTWAASAPVLFASFGNKTFSHNGAPDAYGLHDAGAATANLALQAAHMGMHIHGMGGFDKDTLRAFFGVPSDFDVAAVWALGYVGEPDSVPDNFKDAEKAPRTRKPLDAFVFTEWDKPAKI
jgi:nitroreductase